MMSFLKYLALVAMLLSVVNVAKASLMLGGDLIVAEDGDVIITVLEINAVFSNDLFLFTDDGIDDNDLFISNNQTTPTGSQFNIGNYSAGDSLLFYIYVMNTDYIYYSGNDETLNPDNILHTMVDNEYAENAVFVGFEDLFEGGDLDFDDVTFSISNVDANQQEPSVPEPASFLLMLLSMALFYVFTFMNAYRFRANISLAN